MKNKVLILFSAAAFSLAAPLSHAAAPIAPKTVKINNLTWTVPRAPSGLQDIKPWAQADAYCKQIGFRLPTKDELVALNRSGATPDDWYVNVTTTATPFGTNKHYTVFMGQLDGLGWAADTDGQAITCVK